MKSKAIYTGFPDLDTIIGPLTPGECILVQGTDQRALTSLAMSITSYAARKGNHIVYVGLNGYMETEYEDILRIHDTRAGQFEPSDIYNVVCREYGIQTFEELEARCKAHEAPALIVVDGLQTLIGSQEKMQRPELAQPSLKTLAAEKMSVPVVATMCTTFTEPSIDTAQVETLHRSADIVLSLSLINDENYRDVVELKVSKGARTETGEAVHLAMLPGMYALANILG